MEEVERLMREARGLEEVFEGNESWFNAFHFRYNDCKVDYASHMACNEHPKFDSEKNGKIRGWGKRFAICAILEVWDQKPGITVNALRGLGGILSKGIQISVKAVKEVLGAVKNAVRFKFIQVLDNVVNTATAPAEPVAVVVIGITKVISDVMVENVGIKMTMCDLCAATMLFASKDELLLKNDDYDDPQNPNGPMTARPHARFLNEALHFDQFLDYKGSSNGEPYGNICGMSDELLREINDVYGSRNPIEILQRVRVIYERQVRANIGARLEQAWKEPVSTLVKEAPTVVAGETWEVYIDRMKQSSKAAEKEGGEKASALKEAFIAALEANTVPEDRWTETEKTDVSAYYFTTGTEADIYFFSWRQCGKTLPVWNEVRAATPTTQEVLNGLKRVGDVGVESFVTLKTTLAKGWTLLTSSGCDCGGQCPGGNCPNK